MKILEVQVMPYFSCIIVSWVSGFKRSMDDESMWQFLELIFIFAMSWKVTANETKRHV